MRFIHLFILAAALGCAHVQLPSTQTDCGFIDYVDVRVDPGVDMDCDPARLIVGAAFDVNKAVVGHNWTLVFTARPKKGAYEVARTDIASKVIYVDAETATLLLKQVSAAVKADRQ
jgi:hypothetical protein